MIMSVVNLISSQMKFIPPALEPGTRVQIQYLFTLYCVHTATSMLE
jgi:hypothetical protein